MAPVDCRNCDALPTSVDEDMLEHMLMSTYERSESILHVHEAVIENSKYGAKTSNGPSVSRWSKLGKNVRGAVQAMKHVFAVDILMKDTSKEQCRKAVWSGVLKCLTQRYPGSQLPERLISTLRCHFDSLPLSYAQAGFDLEQVFHHVRLLEQVGHDGQCQPAVVVQEYMSETGRCSNASDLSTSSSLCSSAYSEDDDQNSLESFRVAFACKTTVSRPAITWALESAGVNVKQLHLFEKKGITLGVAIVQCCRDISQPERIQCIMKAAIRGSKASKLTLGLCGCEGRGALVPGLAENIDSGAKKPASETGEKSIGMGSLDFSVDESLYHLFGFPSPGSLHQVITDNNQTVVFGQTVLEQYLIGGDKVQVREPIAVGSSGTVCMGIYKEEIIAVKKLRGCEGGSVIDVELRKDVLGLISCTHKNVLPLHGICIDGANGMCMLMKYMEGGSLFDLVQRTQKMDLVDVIRIAKDIAEGMLFLHERGIVHRDLKSSSILLDGHMHAVIGDLGLVNYECSDKVQYQMGEYRWMAPEVLGSNPESTMVTFMSNVYSFGIILWEMLTCQIPFMGYSPVQAAVGIAAYGLRPTIPCSCLPQLRSLLERCWASYPLDRPQFSEVVEVLQAASVELPS